MTIEPCPECDLPVVVADNNVRLDVPAVDFSEDACWQLMQVGGMTLAAAGGERPRHGRGHVLHEHQPPELE